MKGSTPKGDIWALPLGQRTQRPFGTPELLGESTMGAAKNGQEISDTRKRVPLTVHGARV